jgi:hypothetical protein
MSIYYPAQTIGANRYTHIQYEYNENILLQKIAELYSNVGMANFDLKIFLLITSTPYYT